MYVYYIDFPKGCKFFWKVLSFYTPYIYSNTPALGGLRIIRPPGPYTPPPSPSLSILDTAVAAAAVAKSFYNIYIYIYIFYKIQIDA